MLFCPSYHLIGASPLPLDAKYLFLVGSIILLSMVVQQLVVDLDVLTGEDERLSYSAIFHVRPNCREGT